MKKIYLCLILTTLFTTSCEKTENYDDNYSGIKSVIRDDKTNGIITKDDYFYKNGSLELIKSYYNNDYHTDTYVSSDKISCQNSSNNKLDGVGYENKLYYNKGKIVSIRSFSSSLGPVDYTFEWTGDELTKTIESRNNGDVIYYKYENGNICEAKITNSLEGKIVSNTEKITTYEYDNKKNYLLLLPYSYRVGKGLYFNPVSLAKNNPTKIVSIYKNPESTETITEAIYSYKYNNSGYPIEIDCKTIFKSNKGEQQSHFVTKIIYNKID